MTFGVLTMPVSLKLPLVLSVRNVLMILVPLYESIEYAVQMRYLFMVMCESVVVSRESRSEESELGVFVSEFLLSV